MAAASATLLAFYVTSIVAVVILIALVCVLFSCVLGASRFGVGWVLRPTLARQSTLLGTVVRSFWLRGRDEHRVMIGRADAPRLFTMLDDLSSRIGVAVPDEVSIEMHAGAWVRLQGYRRGAGRTILGLGYDLLAGLSEGEVEAVLAHELSHAKLIQRGLSSWMHKGVGRLVQLATELEQLSDGYRAAKLTSISCDVMYKGADALTRLAARLTATYSRQLEFEADLGAAEVCGSEALRSSRLRLTRLHGELERLPWNERIARVETEPSFSQWLVSEVTRGGGAPATEPSAHAPDPYSTHPTLRDRLRALPRDTNSVVNQRPGIELLANPDDAATALVARIRGVIDTREAKDTAELAKRKRGWETSTRVLPRQWPGILLMMIGGTAAFMLLMADSWQAMMAALGVAAVGYPLYRIANYGATRPLPVPAFGTLTSPRPEGEDRAAAEAATAAELQGRIGARLKRVDLVDAYIAECYAQLQERDYLRAHVAGRLALELDKKSVEAMLGLGIAAAGLGLPQQATKLMSVVRYRTGLRSPNLLWGAAWSLSLLQKWEDTEAMLLALTRKGPVPATYLSLLALARYHRGKLHSAIAASKQACELEPENMEHRKLLAELLLATGRPREAEQLLAGMATVATTDATVASLMVRLHLMLRSIETAISWSEQFRALDGDPVQLAWLGRVFEDAREDAHAMTFYRAALAEGHSPECLLGLARIDAARGDTQAAREHLLAALNVEKPRPKLAKSPVALFAEIVNQINVLDDRLVTCTAWIVELPKGAAHPLSGRTLLVCAPAEDEAKQHLASIAMALSPTAAPQLPDGAWRVAAKNQQPIRPVAPGIQLVLA